MKIFAVLSLCVASVGIPNFASGACPASSMTLNSQTLKQVAAGQNGAGQKVGYFRVIDGDAGGNCTYAFLLDDLGKVYYATLLTAMASGTRVSFWTYSNNNQGIGDIWLPGDQTNASGHTATSINILR